eukprot:2820334-Rhodomonas_salina.1
MGWWKTGDPVATKTKDHLDLWMPKGVEVNSETLRRAMAGEGTEAVRAQLAWATIHEDERLEDYFGAGQASHLRGAEGVVMCTDGSVKLSQLDNGHTKASLGAGLAYRGTDGEDEGIGVEGRADAYEAEGGGINEALRRHKADKLFVGCDTKALLQGMARWQNILFPPSPHDHRIRSTLMTAVGLCAAVSYTHLTLPTICSV